jgi:hypothetical protein
MERRRASFAGDPPGLGAAQSYACGSAGRSIPGWHAGFTLSDPWRVRADPVLTLRWVSFRSASTRSAPRTLRTIRRTADGRDEPTGCVSPSPYSCRSRSRTGKNSELALNDCNWPSRAEAALKFVAGKLTIAGMPRPSSRVCREGRLMAVGVSRAAQRQ